MTSNIISVLLGIALTIGGYLGLHPAVENTFGASVYTYSQGGTGSSTSALGQIPYYGASGLQATPTTTASCSGSATCSSFTILGSSPITISATGGAFPFTPTTNYGALTNATGTPVWFQAGVQASSSSYFVNASTTLLTVGKLYGTDNVNINGGTSHFIGISGANYFSVDSAGPYIEGANINLIPAGSLFLTSPPTTASGNLNITSGGGVYSAASTTFSCSSGINCSYANGVATFTNTYGFPFTAFSWGNATSTVIDFSAGIIVNASTTFANLASGALAVDATGKVYKGATTTDSCSTGITCSFSNGTETFTNSYGYPFTPDTYAGVAVSATSTGIYAKPTSGYGVTASSTFTTFASTSQLSANNSVWFTGITGPSGLAIDGNSKLYASASTTFTSPLTYSAATNAATCATCLTANQSITLSGAVTGTGATAITTAFGTLAQGILGNPFAAATIPTALATSTLYGAASTPGYVLQWSNTGLILAATSTLAQGTGISLSTAGSVTTITNTGALFGYDWTPNATGFYNQLANSTTTQIHFGANNNSLSASSTANFERVVVASSTATSSFQGSWTDFNAITVSTTTATSTFANGIQLTGGCVRVGGVCLTANSGTVTSVATNNGLTGGTITGAGTIGLDTTSLSTNALLTWSGSLLAATGTPQLTVGYLKATSTNATSTVANWLDISALNVSTTTATSTFANGIQITGGGLTINKLTSCDTIDTDANGNLKCGSDQTGAGGGVYPFTPATSFNTAVSATSSVAWFQLGLQSSSTIQATNVNIDEFSSYQQAGQLLVYASSTNQTTVLGLNAGGQTATTSANILNGANTAIGYKALSAVTTSADTNTAVGANSLSHDTSGDNNVALGADALTTNTTGRGLAALGMAALRFNTGDYNTAGGFSALLTNTSGIRNTAFGTQASNLNSTGSQNAAFGMDALHTSVSSSNNVAVGFQAGYSVTGSDNILIGASPALGNLVSGAGNIGIGENVNFPDANGNFQLALGGLIFGTLPATSTGFTLPLSGAFGVGTSSPFAKLSIQANAGDTSKTLFAIGSSTVSATSTLFSVSNTGSTTIGLLGACSGSSALNTTAAGLITCGAVSGSGGAAYPFTPTANFGVTASATGTLTLFTSGLSASSTVNFGNAGVAGFTFDSVNGKQGLGTTSPYATLSINAPAQTYPYLAIGSSTGEVLRIQSATNPTIGVGTTSPFARVSIHAAAGDITFAIGSTTSTYFMVGNTGNVGISTTSPGAKLAVTGDVLVDGTTTARALVLTQTASSSGSTILPVKNAAYANTLIKAYVAGQSNGGAIRIRDSFNVASFTDDGAGLFTLTWQLAFTNASSTAYAAMTSSDGALSTIINVQGSGTVTTQQFRMETDASAAEDPGYFSVIAVGTQ